MHYCLSYIIIAWLLMHPTAASVPFKINKSRNTLSLHLRCPCVCACFFRGSQGKVMHGQRMGPSAMSDASMMKSFPRQQPKQPRPRASEAPPKKRRKWKEQFATSPCASSPEAMSDEEGEK